MFGQRILPIYFVFHIACITELRKTVIHKKFYRTVPSVGGLVNVVRFFIVSVYFVGLFLSSILQLLLFCQFNWVFCVTCVLLKVTFLLLKRKFLLKLTSPLLLSCYSSGSFLTFLIIYFFHSCSKFFSSWSIWSILWYLLHQWLLHWELSLQWVPF